MSKYTYKMADPLPNEKQDRNIDRMNRWERANGMKMSELTMEEWLDVVEAILCLTPSEARQYLSHLMASNL